MKVLGIHASFSLHTHDPAVCLLSDGEILGLYEEERFNRIKLSRGHFPLLALKAILRDNNLTINDIDLIATTGSTNPWLIPKIKSVLIQEFGVCPEITVIPHQEAHMWCALQGSTGEDTMVLCTDAYGDGHSGLLGYRSGEHVKSKLIPKSESLGILYSIGTSLLGFTPGEDEYKVMGLAPYGSSKDSKESVEFFDNLLCEETLSVVSQLRNNYEPYYTSDLFNKAQSIYGDLRYDNDARSSFAFDLQKHFENSLLKLVERIKSIYPSSNQNLAISGGCALNCQANLKLAQSGYNVTVSPIASDRGLAFGAAVGASKASKQKTPLLLSAFQGQDISSDDVENEIRNNGLSSLCVDTDIDLLVAALTQGKIIAICSGKSEVGARSLGHRSILADPSVSGMKDLLNSKIKYRESFRPFAPAVLDEDGHLFFNDYSCSRYMTRNMMATEYAHLTIPECIHVDSTARVQSVVESDGLIHTLLESYKRRKGYGLLINTSFNLKGQPIVQTPRDAIGTFFQCGIDILVFDKLMLVKA